MIGNRARGIITYIRIGNQLYDPFYISIHCIRWWLRNMKGILWYNGFGLRTITTLVHNSVHRERSVANKT